MADELTDLPSPEGLVIATRLQEALDAVGWSKVTLCRNAHISRPSLHKILNGYSSPLDVRHLPVLRRLSLALGKPLYWLEAGNPGPHDLSTPAGVRAARLAAGLSYRALAARAGVTTDAVFYIEHPRRARRYHPSMLVRSAVIAALSTTPLAEGDHDGPTSF